MTVRMSGQESYPLDTFKKKSYPLGTFKKKLPNFHFITKISYGIAENVIMKLSEENPHKYFVLSRYSHKSQQYGIFVVSEVGNLDMEAKTRKIVFSGKKLMLAANKVHLEAAQKLSWHYPKFSWNYVFATSQVNVELFATCPFVENFSPIYQYCTRKGKATATRNR